MDKYLIPVIDTNLIEFTVAYDRSLHQSITEYLQRSNLEYVEGLSYFSGEQEIDYQDWLLQVMDGETLNNVVLYFNDIEEAKELKKNLDIYFATNILHVSFRELPREAWQNCWEEQIVEWASEKFQFKFSFPSIGQDKNNHAAEVFLPHHKGFGTGQHASSRACVALLESFQWSEIKSFLDVGTGTGLLAILAKKLNVPIVDATDICQNSIEEATANAEVNDCKIRVMNVSLPEHQTYDFVIANILYPELLRLSEQLVCLVNSNRGYLAVAGFSSIESEKIKSRFTTLGLKFIDSKSHNSWPCLLFKN